MLCLDRFGYRIGGYLGTYCMNTYRELTRVVPPIFFLFPPTLAELESECCSPSC